MRQLREDSAAQKATGATMYGPIRARWPAWWSGAVQAAEQVRIMEHNAEMRAVEQEAKRR